MDLDGISDIRGGSLARLMLDLCRGVGGSSTAMDLRIQLALLHLPERSPQDLAEIAMAADDEQPCGEGEQFGADRDGGDLVRDHAGAIALTELSLQRPTAHTTR